MQYPKISIVTPTLNSEAFLEECIQSVLSQHYPNLEYIIVDGGSSDNTTAVIERYKDSFYAVIQEADNGAAEAINKGFSISTGEIMYWLNSDDKLHPGALYGVAQLFDSFPQVEWLMGLPTWFSESGAAYSEMSYGYSKFYQSPKYINDSMHLKFARWSKWRFAMGDFSAIQQESVFWRRSLWQKAGGSLQAEIIAYDLELWTRFFQHAKLFTAQVILAGFRVHKKQVSAVQRERYMAESERIIYNYVTTIGGNNLGNTIRKEMARLTRIFYYYRIPYLERIFVCLMDLPDYIVYSLEQERFIFRNT